MKKSVTLFFAAFVLSCSLSYGQNWQWAKSGGSSDAAGSVGMGNDENVYSMATDTHGNIYVLATVQQTAANVDGHVLPTWGDRDNVVLTSFKCDGTYRWSKVFGNNNGGGIPIALKIDTLGGVYVGVGIDNYDPLHLDTDTTIPYSAHLRQLLMVKYDTAGTFKWCRWPEPDTITFAGVYAFNHNFYDIDVDGSGSVYMLCVLSPGAYADGAYIISSPGETMHVLKYSSTGAFISGTQLDVAITGYPPVGLKMKRNARNGRFYITGQLWGIAGGGTLAFAGVPVIHNMYVGCFNSTGGLVWQKQSANVNPSYADASFVSMDMDAAGDIFLTGHSRKADTFNSYVTVNPLTTTPYSVPIIVKMDSNGNNIWAKNAYENDGETGSYAVAVNGNEVAIAGAYGGGFEWPGIAHRYGYPLSTYLYDVFVARFNAATGDILGMDTVASGLLENEYPAAIAADKYGNVYVGGYFDAEMYYVHDTLVSIGGESDFFVAKYGTANCDTLHIPALEIPDNLNNADRQLRIYPNPATNELTIENAPPGSTIRLFNIMGQQVFNGVVSEPKQTISTENIVTGTYILQLTDASGNRINKTIVKQ